MLRVINRNESRRDEARGLRTPRVETFIPLNGIVAHGIVVTWIDESSRTPVRKPVTLNKAPGFVGHLYRQKPQRFGVRPPKPAVRFESKLPYYDDRT